MPSRGRKLMAAVLLAATTITCGLAIADQKPDTKSLSVEPITITARPLTAFSRGDSSKSYFGNLEWRGGVALKSESKNFGGWSGLIVQSDGSQLFAVSDAGTWMTANIDYSNGRLSGLSNARLGPLQALDGNTLRRPRDRDAEAAALLSGTLDKGEIVIGFEQNARIGRFKLGSDGLSAPISYLPLPAEARRMGRNKGFEALAVLRSGPYRGAVIAFAERFLDDEANHTGWIWVGGTARRLALTNIDGFDITDAASLPDGNLLILERRFRWTEGVKMRLRMIKTADVKPGALLSGEVLLEADMRYEIDNMEALGVHRNAQGETIITLMSDDNFNSFFQRTILLQFALKPEARQAVN